MTRAEILAALVACRTSFDDSHAAAMDGFEKRRKQQLGHVLRLQNYTDASDSLRGTLDALIATFSDPEPGDAPRCNDAPGGYPALCDRAIAGGIVTLGDADLLAILLGAGTSARATGHAVVARLLRAARFARLAPRAVLKRLAARGKPVRAVL
jgi:hypothetical protein